VGPCKTLMLIMVEGYDMLDLTKIFEVRITDCDISEEKIRFDRGEVEEYNK